MILKHGMKHQAIEFYKVYINHDPGMILTYLKAMSTKVADAFEWEKLLIYDLRDKISRKWANRQNIYVYENIMSPRGLSAPAPGLYTYT